MLQASVLFFLLSLFVSRFVILGLPAFTRAIEDSYFRNLSVGLTSDIFVFGVVTVIGLCFWYLISRKYRIVSTILTSLFFVIMGILMSANVRYMEHFGLTVRPNHLQHLKVGWMFDAFSGMLVESINLWICFLLPALISLIAYFVFFRGKDFSVISLKKIAGFVVFCLACNSYSINMRFKPGILKELRHNAIIALYENIKEDNEFGDLALPSDESLLAVRGAFLSQRFWATQDQNGAFPLFQKKIAAGNSQAGLKNVAMQKKFHKFVQNGHNQKPWNIVVVLLESHRAHEMQSFGISDVDPKVSKYLDALAHKGIRFTENYATGLQTRHGQIGAMCSIYGLTNYSIMINAPTTPMVCLGDVFKANGYENYFLNNADGSFDNQEDFYRYHNHNHTVLLNDFPDDAIKGGWGVSDHELFNRALAEVADQTNPFFMTMTTLTNHNPFVVPDDAPNFIDRSLPVQLQVVQYVDWAIADFYKKMIKRHPHTLFIITSDQGAFRLDPPAKNEKSLSYVRRIARVPLIILADEMPKDIQGVEVSSLSSIADIAPTLFSALGWTNINNQFMGSDAFTRSEPVFINWREEGVVLEAVGFEGSPVRQKLKVMPMDINTRDTIEVLARFNRLIPLRDSLSIDNAN